MRPGTVADTTLRHASVRGAVLGLLSFRWAVGLSMVTGAWVAFAAEPSNARATVQLAYDVPAACPDRATFESWVGARLGYDPFEPGVSPRTARVVIAPTAGNTSELSAVLGLESASGASEGRRTLRVASSDCSAAAGSLALALAMSLDPQRAAAPPSQNTRASREPRMGAVPPPSPPEPREVTPAVPIAFGLHTSGGAAFGIGVAPGGFFAVSPRWTREAWSLALEGELIAAASADLAGGRIESNALRGGLEICRVASLVHACVRGGAGRLQVRGEGFVDAREGALPQAYVGPRLRLETSVWRGLRAGLLADAEVSLIRGTVRVGDDVAWRRPLVGGKVGATVGWMFP